jgi:choline dehydrogenase
VNPLDTPVINFNSFDTGTTANNSDQLDLQASYEGIQLARQANANLAALVAEYGSAYSSSPQGLTPFTEVFPGTQHTGDDLKNVIKNEAFGHHASCTAAIGANDDPLAVLDTNFKVRGVKGLRVVDASSFPKTPGFFPAVPLYMMSEKAAIVIAKDQNVTISYAG